MRRGLALALLSWSCARGPVPAAERVAAREIGFVDQSAAIQGRDGGGSALLWGRSIFTFGDTVLNQPDAGGQNWHHNSCSFTHDERAADGIAPLRELLDEAGAPRYLLAPTADEAEFNEAHRGDPCRVMPCGARYAVWPGTPVWDAAQQRALVLYGLIYAEPGAFNFHGVGQSIAVWRRFEDPPERPRLREGVKHPTLMWAEGEPAPATAPVVAEDRLWAFECREGTLSRPCVLHGAPLSQVLERGAWRVWDGAGWSEDPGRAQVLFDGAPIMSVSWNAYLSSWVAVYSVPLSNDVVLRTAPALTGPWSAPLLLFIADAGASEGPAYDAMEHAQFAEDQGRIIYITHSRPDGRTWFSGRFPLIQIELRRMTGT